VTFRRSLGGRSQAELDGGKRRLRSIGHALLAEHVGDPIAGSLRTQTKDAANLGIGLASPELSQHVQLARRE